MVINFFTPTGHQWEKFGFFFHFTSMISFEALLLEEHTSYLRHWTQFRGKMSVNRIYPPQASEGRPYEAYIQHDQYTLDTAVNT